ncbi:hypothetical protein [Paraburkholderia fynbosensis]|uniref:Lipoprotein n=1 Tax=Paraburkholderia fynbosensis TaxID=1200993 RepID=A0A6J5GC69_9BURK|nr:hypothetical protein [Paraburkholderia fynbosensis]CAB3796095.1 hypothetical protein LMG27177_04030 [Paraburkholderia fynbosensis]
MKLHMKYAAIAASIVLLAIGTTACKRADNSSDAGSSAVGASGTMSAPATPGAMGASGASQ